MSLDEYVGEDKHHAESFKPGALALIQLASYALEGSYKAIETSLGRGMYFFLFFSFFLLASWLPGFSAFCWFMRLLVAFWLWLFASSAFPVPVRQVAFWLLRLFAGLCSAWRLWLFASSAFTVPLWAFWLLHPFIGFWIWFPHHQYHQFLPNYLNHYFFEHLGGEAPPPN